MKKSIIRFVCLLCAAAPLTATAQKNILSAFDAIIKCDDAQIIDSHTLERDPATMIKTGQSDVYNFVMPANRMSLIKNVISAFNEDSKMAYTFNRGTTTASGPIYALAVGNGDGNTITMSAPDYEYIYAGFLAPKSESPDGIYRYCYGMDFKEEDGKIVGKLVVTYATTLIYRQQLEQQRQYDRFRNMTNSSITIPSDQADTNNWFSTMMSYFQSMTSANSQTRIALASKAYQLIRAISEDPDVTESDKNTVREILKGMISDSKYSETVLNNLLNQCLVNLK